METTAMLIAEEVTETSRLGDTPPSKFEEEELDLLAFEMWMRACCPEKALDPAWSSAAKEAWSHASSL